MRSIFKLGTVGIVISKVNPVYVNNYTYATLSKTYLLYVNVTGR
jgi:hypothetical protein